MRYLKQEMGCSQIIFGCTELPLVIDECLRDCDFVAPDDIIDSTDVTAEAVVRIAKGEREVSDYNPQPSVGQTYPSRILPASTPESDSD